MRYNANLRRFADRARLIKEAEKAGFINSAVLVLIDDKNRVILTKRSENLSVHGGQFSFAGGKKDKSDKNFRETALREAHEELGIFPYLVGNTNEMPPVLSPRGYIIYPFLSRLSSDIIIKVNPKEVSKVIKVPTAFFRRNPVIKRYYLIGNLRVRADFYRFGHHLIWGATARILSFTKHCL